MNHEVGARDRVYRAVIVQSGAHSKIRGGDSVLALADGALQDRPGDLVVFAELATLPYFPVSGKSSNFDLAEPLNGPTVGAFCELARKHHVNVVAPLFERGSAQGAYYDSAVIINRMGRLVSGRMTDGRSAPAFRKVHISCHADYAPPINEKLYFRGGAGFPVFELDGVRVGCLVCYDRSFPESWRTLALAGVDIVAIPTASFASRRAQQFVSELQTACIQNGVFGLAANKAGVEHFDGCTMNFFGRSCAIDPFGSVLAEAGEEPDRVIYADLDLSLAVTWGRRYHYMRDRRPDAYEGLLG